jgi:hypothetical protein
MKSKPAYTVANEREIERLRAMASLETEDQVRSVLRATCKREGSQRKWAAKVGVSEAFLSDVLRGKRNVTSRFLRELGYEQVRMFRRTRQAEPLDG